MSTKTTTNGGNETESEWLDDGALPDMTVDHVDSMELLGATVMVGEYPDGSKQFGLTTSTPIDPLTAAWDTDILQFPAMEGNR